MPRPTMRDEHHNAVQPAFGTGHAPKHYLIASQDDAWFIRFDGDRFGPYRSEREAMLFAIDAANTLGQQGEDTQVQITDERGDVRPVWTFGQDPYPPRL